MPVYSYQNIVPVIDPTSFLHPTASLIGDVIIGPGCYIGPGASLRGDFGRVIVEGDSSIQDNCTIHTSSNNDCIVGRGATIGHGAVLHGCKIGCHTLVGINAVVLDNGNIGDECLIAALSLVRMDAVFPDRSLLAGNPARIVRAFAPEQITWRNTGDGEYQRLTRESFTDFEECRPLESVEPNRPRVRSKASAVRLHGKISNGNRSVSASNSGDGES